MKHRYPKVSENFKILSRHRLLFGYVTFTERALAFDGMRQACLADKPDMDNLYVKYYLAYLH